VVDDGSADDTGAVAEAFAGRLPRLRLIRLSSNRGKGYAVRTGVLASRGRRVLFCDADGATRFEDLARLEAELEAGHDVAIGSRALASAATTIERRLVRHLLGRAFHQAVRWLAVRGISDTQCGFKLFTSVAAHDLFGRSRMPGFSFDVEVLLLAQLRGYRVAEVPVNWVHQPGSRVNVVADGLRMLVDIARIRANVARGAYDARRHPLSPLTASDHLAPGAALS
jgi:dolichyl-phosphate beta-glucosyltransferase